MKPFSKKILIISLGLVLTGIICTTIGFALGGHSGFVISNAGISPITSQSAAEKLPMTKLDDFSNVELNVPFSDITILPSDDEAYYLEYLLYENSGKASYKITNDTLFVTQRERGITMGFMSAFSLDTTLADSYLRLYVPKDQVLNTLQLYTESGTVSIDRVKADTVDLGLDFGELTIKDSVFSTLVFDSESTEMKLTDSEISDFTLNGSFGDVSLKNFVCDSATIALESSEVLLDAVKLETLDYTNDFGDLTLHLPEHLDMYSFDVAVEFGEIQLPNDAPPGYHNNDDNEVYKTNGTGTPRIKIASESGDIAITKRR